MTHGAERVRDVAREAPDVGALGDVGDKGGLFPNVIPALSLDPAAFSPVGKGAGPRLKAGVTG